MQGSVKLFTNDFEAALKKLLKKPIDLINVKNKPETTKIVSDYLNERLKFKINDKPVAFKLVGFENEAEAIWMYIEFEKSSPPKKVEIENKIETAPKTVKKAKDEFTKETYDFLHQVLVDFAIDTKYRPQLKVILQNSKAEPKNNSSI